MAVTPNYDDKRLVDVEVGKQQALTELEQTYEGMIDKSDTFYQQQIGAAQEWADKQTQLQQEQTDFTIQKIEQQKEQAQKDYLKEQSGAYVDWQKQSDEYGANAEQMATAGMSNTGFSESSQVAMYTAYQNRVAVAREVVNQAIMNYNNGIKEAQLANNAVLAEIHFNALQQQLQLALEGFQYENQLILDLSNKKLEVEQVYHQRYQDVLAQINHENSMAEQIRQFNLEYNEQIRQFNQEIARLKAKDSQEAAMEAKRLEMQKQQYEAEMSLKKQQLAEEKRQFDQQLAFQKSQAAKSSSGGGSSSVKKSSSGGGSGSVTKSPSAADIKKAMGQGGDKKTSNYDSALNYYNKMVAAGKSKSQVLSDITSAYKNGQLTKDEYTKLKSIFNVRGVQY